ncbi:DNA cytosine methyltransferase [Streptomyces bacillaris]
MSYSIGSLFSGTGILDVAIQDVFDSHAVWHSQYEPPDKKGRPDVHQYAAKILARHWPTTPNLGDITAIDWQAVLAEHGPVDIVSGGFPCGDVSVAGLQAGITPHTRSGLWAHMAAAIDALNPQLVVIENVEGLLHAPAHRGLGPTDPDVEAAGDNALRALGAVLGDLANRRLDAEWLSIDASAVGALHRRRRIIVLAWPAAPHPSRPRLEIRQVQPDGHQRKTPQRSRHELAGPPVGGAWAPAVTHWARTLGRPAPQPADARGEINPAFSEWLMGFPDGWVTDTPAPPGMSQSALRDAQLHAIGNSVCRQQIAAGIRTCYARATAGDMAAAA